MPETKPRTTPSGRRVRSPGVPAFLPAFLLAVGPAFAGQLAVSVSQARNDSGRVRCGLFDRADGWRDEEQALRAVDAAVVSGKATCDFGSVPAGEYAIAVFHAEQGEPRVEYGFLGKPRQGVGFSNNPSITFGAPGFDTAKVSVGDDDDLNVEVMLKY